MCLNIEDLPFCRRRRRAPSSAAFKTIHKSFMQVAFYKGEKVHKKSWKERKRTAESC